MYNLPLELYTIHNQDINSLKGLLERFDLYRAINIFQLGKLRQAVKQDDQTCVEQVITCRDKQHSTSFPWALKGSLAFLCSYSIGSYHQEKPMSWSCIAHATSHKILWARTIRHIMKKNTNPRKIFNLNSRSYCKHSYFMGGSGMRKRKQGAAKI